MSKSAIAVLAAIALGAGACGSDGRSSGATTAVAPAETATPTAAATIALSLTETGCDPVTLTAPAGAVTFNVDNGRDAKAEFEILSATPKILTEEFLEPGASGSFTMDLVAGEYQVICGRPSDTRAALTVTGEGGGAAGADGRPGRPRRRHRGVRGVRGPAGRPARRRHHRARHGRQGSATSPPPRRCTRRCAGRGSASSRSPSCFPDSDGAIDSRVDDFSGPDDPKFTGFHRIEKGLWEDGSTNGLDTFADQLDDRRADAGHQRPLAADHARTSW